MSETLAREKNESDPYEFWETCLKEAEHIQLQYAQRDGVEHHLAPNGMFSKLPELYAKVVRTPSFLGWFGNWVEGDQSEVSKVIYSDTKEPMLVFHGTSSHLPPSEGLVPQPARDAIFHQTLFFSPNLVPVKAVMRVRGGGRIRASAMYSCFLKIVRPVYSKNQAPSNPPIDRQKYDGAINADGYECIILDKSQRMHLPTPVELLSKV